MMPLNFYYNGWKTTSYRLKQLFKFLYTEKLSSEDFSLYIFTNFVIRKKVVTVLPNDAQEALTKWNSNSSSTKQARDYAICMLALRLMLRKSDVFKQGVVFSLGLQPTGKSFGRFNSKKTF
jgi:hypothetical protein